MPSGFFGGVGIGPQAIGRSGAPADPVPVAGAELLTNGGFDSDTAWTKQPEWTISDGTANANATTTRYIYQSASPLPAAGQYLFLSWQLVARTGNGIRPSVGGFDNPTFITAPGSYVLSARQITTNVTALFTAGNGTVASIDNVSVFPLNLSSLLSTRTYASADCDLSAAITRTAGTQAGLCARLDSASTPANFIIAYLDGAGNVKVDKCVAGVYTNVISGAVTYGSTKRLRLVCSGTSVSTYYDGTQVGSTVTVSDAGIVSNTRHGKFSTYASNAFAGYVAA